jgi:hypothetical protein
LPRDDEPTPTGQPDPDAADAWRAVGRFLADCALQTRPPLHHDGRPCGQRAYCPRGCDPIYPQLELLANGDLLVRCCLGRLIRRGESGAAEFFAAFDR